MGTPSGPSDTAAASVSAALDHSPRDFYATLARTGFIRRVLELARDEDLGGPDGLDVTSAACIPESARGRAKLSARVPGIAAGLITIPEILDAFGATTDVTILHEDGHPFHAGACLAEFSGPLGQILTLERTCLNLISRLSGIATQTAAYVAAVPRGSKAVICDTRKTTPGLRVLEKYAVRCGGGRSHRLGLHDAVLIKDNHLASRTPDQLAAFVADAVRHARRLAPGPLAFVEVEADTLDQVDALLTLPRGVLDIILCDNMAPPLLREAVARRDAAAPWLLLEASGGVSLEAIPEIAGTGVDRISVGALTHGVKSLDLGLDITA